MKCNFIFNYKYLFSGDTNISYTKVFKENFLDLLSSYMEMLSCKTVIA